MRHKGRISIRMKQADTESEKRHSNINVSESGIEREPIICYAHHHDVYCDQSAGFVPCVLVIICTSCNSSTRGCHENNNDYMQRLVELKKVILHHKNPLYT